MPVRLGVNLPTFGPHAGPAAVAAVATAAERLGLHAVSATERLLLPADPAWRNEAGLPEWPVLDPIEALTWAAAHTSRVRLATGVVDALFQPPLVLARRLATLDVLSGGRVDAGLGQGWLPEEFAATGVPMSRRGPGFEDYLAAVRACWGPDPVAHDGPAYPLPPSRVGPKPVNGTIPLLVGALARPAVERTARLGLGLVAAVRDWDTTATEVGWYRAAGGPGPVSLRTLAGEDVAGAVARAGALGVDEVHWALPHDLPPGGLVAALESIVAAAG
ncbi:MAG TPA: LLM class flavin-dependent oxidoreductase [Acidimicrobiales bacterium]|nr:LLM class flavin-dependent oxidoreductase [Acidimicrobiales bacterium]